MGSRGTGRRDVGWIAVAIGVVGVACGSPAAAQMVGPRMASCAQLEATLDSLRAVAARTTDDDEREQLQNQIGGLAYRLQEGDVWPGDVIDLSVPGLADGKWTGQFTVTPSRQLELPDIDPIPVEGILYAELEEKLASALARYLREPRVRAQVLKRIGVLGQVGSPGFYEVPGSSLVSEVIMQAGGPGPGADVDDVEFRRFGEEIETGRERVVWQNLSLDQLGVRSGDEMYVPGQGSGGLPSAVLGAVTSALGLAFLFIRVF